MDQDAFRQLLTGSRKPQPITTASSKHQKPTTSAASEPAFKPRKVKKTESKYRDRAAERRDGVGNDYADVEAVLEDFERRLAGEDRDVIEEQRKYLGGDSQHTILVKGLDMSLVEQNRTRAAAATEDDEILEQAFVQATSISEPPEPRKRTRADIIRDLKAKRQNKDESPVIEQPVENRSAQEAAKNAGKFRPIGFKPIGQTEAKEKSKKRRVKDGREGVKKKKQKVESPSVPPESRSRPTEESPAIAQVAQERETTESASSAMHLKPPEPEPTSPDEDFDIFAGAGDYEGFPVDEESEEENGNTEDIRATTTPQYAAVSLVPDVVTKNWFNEPEPEVRQPSIPPEKSPPIPDAMAAEEEPPETRLKPLESSTLPSIRDFLAMDEAVEKAEKRKARKEKKKKKKVGGDEDDD